MNDFLDVNEQNLYKKLKSPIMQEIIMSNVIGGIAMILSEKLHITPLRALMLFYDSKTCANLHNKETGLYLYGNNYIANEFIIEKQYD